MSDELRCELGAMKQIQVEMLRQQITERQALLDQLLAAPPPLPAETSEQRDRSRSQHVADELKKWSEKSMANAKTITGVGMARLMNTFTHDGRINDKYEEKVRNML